MKSLSAYIRTLIPKDEKNSKTIYNRMFNFASILTYNAYPLLETGYQAYNDIIVGNITWISYFKNFEYRIVLFFIMSSIYYFFSIIFFMKSYKFNENSILLNQKYSKNYTSEQKLLIGINLSVIVYLIFKFIIRHIDINDIALCFMIIVPVYIYIYLRKNNVKENNISENLKIISIILFFIYAYFGYIAIISFLQFIKPTNQFIPKNIQNINRISIIIIFILNSFYAYLIAKKEKNLIFLFVVQLLLPLLNIIVIKDTYIYQGKILNLNIPLHTKIIIFLLIIGFTVYNVLKIIKIKKINSKIKINDCILITTNISICVFSIYRIAGYGYMDDFHLGEPHFTLSPSF